MKEILIEYGQATIALFIFLFILSFGSRTVSFGTQFMKKVEANMVQELQTNNFYSYATTGGLDFNYANAGINEFEHVKIADHLQARGNGFDANVYICAILDEEGNLVRTAEQQKEEWFVAPKAGVYSIYFWTKDGLGRKQYGHLNIPIQRVL